MWSEHYRHILSTFSSMIIMPQITVHKIGLIKIYKNINDIKQIKHKLQLQFMEYLSEKKFLSSFFFIINNELKSDSENNVIPKTHIGIVSI